MKANELRIGNWVNVLHGDVQIEKWVNDGARFTDGNGGTFESLSPIPLTEKWLLRFGFRVNSGIASREFLLGDFKAIDQYEDGFLFIRKFWQAGKMVQHVHQLQNLYFALTGEELEAKG